MSGRRKALEVDAVRALLAARIIPASTPVVDREAPDFLLEFESGPVGLEVTALYRPPTELGAKAWEASCEAILQLAKKRWIDRQQPPRHVSIVFDKRVPLPKSDWSAVAEELVVAAAAAALSAANQVVIGLGALEPVSISLPRGIRTMVVSQTSFTRSFWSLSQSGSIQPLPAAMIRDAIATKEKLLPTYRRAAPVVWLAIVLNRFRYASDYSVSDSEAQTAMFTTGFDRVFLVILGSQAAVWELDTADPSE